MTTLWLGLSLVLPLGAGLAVCELLWPGLGAPRRTALLRLSLSVGLGLGLFSVITFLWSLLFGPPGRGAVWPEVIVLGGLSAGVWLRRGRMSDPRPAVPARPGAPLLIRALWGLLLLTLVAAVGVFVLVTIKEPHGGWDAWSIWNLRARIIFRGTGLHWSRAFSPLISLSHPQYPLLTSLCVARIWGYLGQDLLLVPALVAGLFTFATAGLLLAAVTRLRGRTRGLLAACILLGTPGFVREGASQYADVVVAYYFLAGSFLLVTGDQAGGGRMRRMALCGLAAGLAGWTKDEGLLFISSLLVAALAGHLLSRGSGNGRAKLLGLLGGLVPLLLLIAGFKLLLAPAGGTMADQQLTGALARLGEGSRYLLVARFFGGQLLTGGGLCLAAVALYLVLLGPCPGPRQRPAVVSMALLLGLMAGGYLVIYIITPIGLEFLLQTTFYRLVVQLWPSFVFLIFLVPRQGHGDRAAADKASGKLSLHR